MASNALVNIFRTHELRQRIFFTIFILIIFRLGAVIPLPGIDFIQLRQTISVDRGGGGTSVDILDYLDLFVGGALKNYSVFMLGIMPYITCSIVMQLLLIVFPRLKKISEEEGGRKKIQRYTRYATVFVTLVQSYFFIKSTIQQEYLTKTMPFTGFIILAMITVAAGTVFLMWMGEQINQRGIGNGISLLIFAGIVVRIPTALSHLGVFRSFLRFVEDVGVVAGFWRRGYLVTPYTQSSFEFNPVFVIMALVMFVIVVGLIIYEQRGQRKIPVHYAKRVIGRKMYGAQNTYIPFKLNPSGVIPVIFASTILITPIQLLRNSGVKFLRDIANFLAPGNLPYLIIYSLLIIFFAYFYTQVTLNPLEISKQIRENGGSIPGIRSEKMEEHLMRILNRIILPGAIFLAFIAVIPSVITKMFGFPWTVSNIMGGTSLIIMVGVGLDTMSQIEGHLRMHHHEGLVRKGKIKARNL